MCFIDTQIGRLIPSNSNGVSVAAGGQFTIPANNKRISLRMLFLNSSQILFGPADDGLTAATRPAITGAANFLFTLAQEGQLCQKSFTVFNVSASTVTFTWIEAVAPEWLLALDLEKLKRMYNTLPIGP